MRPHPAGAPHPLSPQLTLVGAVVEDVEGLHGGRASLLVPENEVDPLVEVRRDVLRLLQGHGVSRGGWGHPLPPTKDLSPVGEEMGAAPSHQGFAVLVDEVLTGARPPWQHHVVHLLVGDLQAAQVEAWGQ